MFAIRKVNRRRFLRGAMNGAAVTLGLPLLDCFLNTNGTALASGAPLPPVFVTWFQGNGLTPGLWEPKTLGPGYEMTEFMKALAPYRDKISFIKNVAVAVDGHSAIVHTTGVYCITSGGVTQDGSLPTIDTLIADSVGQQTRFRSLQVSCNGTPMSYSRRSASAINPSEPSPLAFYQRLFGPEFVDPNGANFKPDPVMMARRSVLSAYTEQRRDLMKTVGAADRARLDEYFTALRDLEQQLDQSLQKPAPLEACTVPPAPTEEPKGRLIADATQANRLFAQLLAHALACGQTRVANVLFTEAASGLRAPTSPMTFHIFTHEEQADPKLGYQPTVAWFMQESMSAFHTFLQTLDAMREGPSSLLDRAAVMYQSDHGFAKRHTLVNIPMIVAGRAGGRLKSGLSLDATGESPARVGLTLQKAFGVPISSWGTESNRTTKVFEEMLA